MKRKAQKMFLLTTTVKEGQLFSASGCSLVNWTQLFHQRTNRLASSSSESSSLSLRIIIIVIIVIRIIVIVITTITARYFWALKIASSYVLDKLTNSNMKYILIKKICPLQLQCANINDRLLFFHGASKTVKGTNKFAEITKES